MKPAKEINQTGSRSDAEAFRADLDRRYTTPFIFKPWQRIIQAYEPQPAARWIRRVVIMISGGTVLAVGVAMIVLPGPAIIVIPAGLAILAIEFAWARRWLRSVRAVLPAPHDDRPLKQKVTFQSMRRSLGFLFRVVRRTLLPKSAIPEKAVNGRSGTVAGH